MTDKSSASPKASSGPGPSGRLTAEAMARHIAHEHGRSPFSDNLKEIVYGGLDGIITTFAVVSGFSGAALLGAGGNGEAYAITLVLLFGLANLLADGVSMGLGDFLSSRSEQARWNRERGVKIHEIAHNSDQEYEETVHLLEEQGLSADDARTVADIYRRYPELWADWMMEHELQMEDMSTATPAKDGFVTFTSFLVFGVIPLLPYLAFWGRDISSYTLFILASTATVIASLAVAITLSASGAQNGLCSEGRVIWPASAAAILSAGTPPTQKMKLLIDLSAR